MVWLGGAGEMGVNAAWIGNVVEQGAFQSFVMAFN